MAKNLLNNYVELNKEDKESLLKLLKEDLRNIDSQKLLKKYDEITINDNTYFVLKIDEKKHEVTYCMKNVLSREEMLKYFTDPWYQDSSDYCVRYNSDVRNNRYEDSYIYKVLNSSFKEDKLKELDIIGDVRLLTKEEVENLDEKHRNINKWYWTMTPYNNMENLEDGSNAYVFIVSSSGSLGYNNVNSGYGVRPVFTLITE